MLSIMAFYRNASTVDIVTHPTESIYQQVSYYLLEFNYYVKFCNVGLQQLLSLQQLTHLYNIYALIFVKLNKPVTMIHKITCSEHYLSPIQVFLSGMHASRPVKSQFEMGVLGDQSPIHQQSTIKCRKDSHTLS